MDEEVISEPQPVDESGDLIPAPVDAEVVPIADEAPVEPSFDEVAAGILASEGFTQVYPATPDESFPPIPTIGRVVHYVLPSGMHAAAIVTWGGDMAPSLAVLPDPFRDGVPFAPLPDSGAVFSLQPMQVLFAPSVTYGEVGKPGTWHWPER